MNTKADNNKKAVSIHEYYNKAWAYMHAYARRYRRAFYSMYTL
jgi:hypothetical protein